MRRTALLLAFALSASLASSTIAATYRWECDVAEPSVSRQDESFPQVQSAGYLAFLRDGSPWYSTEVESLHRLLRQSDGLIMDQEFVYAPAEVHTNVTSAVPKGYAYYAKIDGSRSLASSLDFASRTTNCPSSWLVLEAGSSSGSDSGDPYGDGGEHDPNNLPGGTPILVDLGGGGMSLTDLAGGARFDLNGDGALDEVAWTPPTPEDGWLALDRNGNGFIDDGTELFGNFTSQPEVEEPHGYLALAVFDSASEGGNEDNTISPADDFYSLLLVWRDLDGNGLSAADELASLSELGISEIDLGWIESRRRDRHGNEFRYASAVRIDGRTTRSADVFLLVSWGE